MTAAANPAANPASEHQNAAADPSRNVWLVANAGSGKTKVLIDRVARLLLRGVSPQNILCLTYTKAAAAEMQNRLFQRLGGWAMAPEPALLQSLAALDETRALSPAMLRRARQLFARAIETPGGIRIQTIHSFCAGILRRFPLEAGVSPGFTDIDERSSSLLQAEVLDAIAQGPDGADMARVLLSVGEEKIDTLIRQFLSHRAALMHPTDRDVLAEALELPAGLDEGALLSQTFLGTETAILTALAEAMRKGTPTEAKSAALLTTLANTPPGLALIEALEGPFLFGKDAKKPFAAKVGSFPTKATQAALGPMIDPLNALMERIETARPLRIALTALRGAERMQRIAAAFLARYEAEKAARGWLDFDDLIARATALLTDPAIAPWVLFRLDGDIDHILVDEAQDTSPAQWKIVAALTGEFTSGKGARDVDRSLFVVGDKKQSIYSFQGADLPGFERVKDAFKTRFAGAEAALVERPLIYSFRSSTAILQVVDRTFQGAAAAALGDAFEHRAFHAGLPGRVDLWEPVPKSTTTDDRKWFDPLDLPSEADAVVVLADRLADQIGAMLRDGTPIPADADGTFRPIAAGDILILVQRRGTLFREMIRACKSRGLPIAGADRLKLSDDLAVRDILSLLSFVNTPEDDLALATALRSPLFGWSEAQLYDLAHGRAGHLWAALRDQGHQGGGDPATLAVISDLLARAEYLRPYELIERILTRHHGRARLLGRLGDEAADAIDELLSQAMIYERAEVPSLTGFLVWMQDSDVEARRQADGDGGAIRVMTVHGAKGLEAPLVILPETQDRRLDEKDRIIPMGQGSQGQDLVVWSGSAGSVPEAVQRAKDDRRAAREDENLRLLYVALTRAKTWLIVAGAGDCGQASWHGLVRTALSGLPTVPLAAGGLRHQTGDWRELQPDPDGAGGPVSHAAAQTKGAEGPDVLPGWALVPPDAASAPPRIFSPSRLGGAALPVADPWQPEGETQPDATAVPAADAAGSARERGVALHLALDLLAALPPQARMAQPCPAGIPADLWAQGRTILSSPDLEWLFGPDSLGEASLAAPWNGGRLIGAADRLIIRQDHVIVVDFKSGAHVPATADQVPEPYLRQLGAYAHALRLIYPDHRIDTAILWTRGPLYMPLDPDIVSAALARAAIP